MKDKSFKSFIEEGCTDRQQKILSKSYFEFFHFYIGHRVGYLAWRLGISANLLCLLRMIAVGIAFSLLLQEGPENISKRLLGAALIIFQKIADYGDGPIARVTRTSSPVGRQLDILGDIAPKFMSLVLLACCTPFSLIIPTSGFLIYLHVKFDEWLTYGRTHLTESTRNPYYINYVNSGKIPEVNTIARYSITFPILLYLLPLFIAMFNSPEDFLWFNNACLAIYILFFALHIYLYWATLVPSNNEKRIVNDDFK